MIIDKGQTTDDVRRKEFNKEEKLAVSVPTERTYKENERNIGQTSSSLLQTSDFVIGHKQ